MYNICIVKINAKLYFIDEVTLSLSKNLMHNLQKPLWKFLLHEDFMSLPEFDE